MELLGYFTHQSEKLVILTSWGVNTDTYNNELNELVQEELGDEIIEQLNNLEYQIDNTLIEEFSNINLKRDHVSPERYEIIKRVYDFLISDDVMEDIMDDILGIFKFGLLVSFIMYENKNTPNDQLLECEADILEKYENEIGPLRQYAINNIVDSVAEIMGSIDSGPNDGNTRGWTEISEEDDLGNFVHPNPIKMECQICCEHKGVCVAYDAEDNIQPGIICEDCLLGCMLIHPLTKKQVVCFSPFTHHPDLLIDEYRGNTCYIQDPELFRACMIVAQEYNSIVAFANATSNVD